MRLNIIGHSHILTLQSGINERIDPANTLEFILLRDPRYRLPAPGLAPVEAKRAADKLSGINQEAVVAAIRAFPSDAAVLSLNGNESAGVGLLANASAPPETKLRRIRQVVERRLPEWFEFLLPLLPERVLFFPPPPPLSESGFGGALAARFADKALEPFSFRMAAWKAHCEVTREVCARHGVQFVDVPREALDANGFRQAQFAGEDPFHGNEAYGRLLLDKLVRAASDAGTATHPAAGGQAGTHPYAALPDHSFWKQSISRVPPADVDPLADPPFRISRGDRVATAGSCFAQHISRRLQSGGFDFLVTEEPAADRPGNEDAPLFSARYGNIYTARQLLQLFDRAFGSFRPVESAWEKHGGGFCDPFRPRFEAQGFPTVEALQEDQQRHFAAVRTMFRELDVLVFTLGLTEAWYSRLDGAVYPVAPGVVGGVFDPAKHAFVNFSVQDVVDDLSTFIQRLRLVNEQETIRIILTVSPVPLVATATGGHVLTSTIYSKSVLRVAAEELRRKHGMVCYFPSYEIITGPQAAGSYFHEDRRSVTEQGVDHVMRVFMKGMTIGGDHEPAPRVAPADAAMESMDNVAEAFCDEEMLARHGEARASTKSG